MFYPDRWAFSVAGPPPLVQQLKNPDGRSVPSRNRVIYCK